MNKDIIMLGSGGHAKSLIHILESVNKTISAVFSPNKAESTENFPDSEHYHDDVSIHKFNSKKVLLVNGIGAMPENENRKKVQKKFKQLGYNFLSLVSDSSNLAKDVQLKNGVQILNGVIVNSGSIIGCETILNTGVIVEHGCEIGSNCHLAPGAIICGDVKINNDVFIGPGAILARGVEIGEGSIIGAGSKIFKNIKPNTKVIQKL